jgi:pimeloyl-ACP methyl ester carboxylesterase
MYELLNQLGLDSVNILGWSDGGNTGLIMAMQYPEKVKRLATMGANIFINTDAVKAPIFREINKQLKQLGKDTSAKALNDRRLMHLLLEEPNMKFDDLSTIHCPVLVMAGENDLIREQHTKGIAQHIAGAQLVIFPKGTHYIPQENAPLFNKTVLEFLKK